MREIEVLVKCSNTKEELVNKLADFEFVKEDHIIDTYYYDELRTNLQPDQDLKLNECFRVREKSNSKYITYKVDKFDDKGIWLYSDEYETEVKDSNALKAIISKLGLKELITINNKKLMFKTDKYEIVVEDVLELGLFVEVELLVDTNEDVNYLKNEIRNFIDSLKLYDLEELNEGKPELMLKKQQKTIKK